MINQPLPLNREYSRNPNTIALERLGFYYNHGSTLGFRVEGLVTYLECMVVSMNVGTLL